MAERRNHDISPAPYAGENEELRMAERHRRTDFPREVRADGPNIE